MILTQKNSLTQWDLSIFCMVFIVVLCNFEWMSIDDHISSNGIRTLIHSDKLIKQRQTNTQWRMFPSTSDYFRIHLIWLEKPYKIKTNVRFKCGHLSWNLIISSPYFTMFLLMFVSLPMLCVAMFELHLHWFENAHIMLSRKINWNHCNGHQQRRIWLW